MSRSRGWYHDPVTVGAARFWDGVRWTQQVAWGSRRSFDPTPLDEVDRRDREQRRAVVEDYLFGAAARGVVAPDVLDRLRADLAERPVAERPQAPLPAPVATPTPAARPAPTVRPTPATRPPVAPAVRAARPMPASTTAARPAVSMPAPVVSARIDRPVTEQHAEPGWWERARTAARSDLALHGLAYLGVLLMFAGVAGLIVFSFASVRPGLRTLAELLVPTTLFVAAWFLARQGARVVASSLTLLGGAVLPLVVAAMFTDGAPFPPDITGPALPVVQGLSWLAIAGGMALVASRSPASPLRYLAGPVLWLGAGLLAGVTRSPVPTGEDVARPTALQLAIALAAVAATMLVIARRATPGPLGRATSTVALPVAALLAVVELLVAESEGWPVASTLVAGVSLFLLAPTLGRRITAAGVTAMQVAAVAIAAARLSAHLPSAWLAAGTVVVLLTLGEWAGRHRPTALGTASVAGALAVAWAVTLVEPWPGALTSVAVAAWALARRLRPSEWLPADRFGVVPVTAVVLTVVELGRVVDPGPGIVALAAVMLVLSVLVRMVPGLRRDSMLLWSIPAGTLAVAVVSLAMPWEPDGWYAAGASVLATGAVVALALPGRIRTWLATAVLVWTGADVAVGVDLGAASTSVVVAALGLAVLLAALAVRWPIAPDLAVIGHGLALAGPIVAGERGWPLALAVGALTLGWAAVAIVEQFGAAVHFEALRRSPGIDQPTVAALERLPALVVLLGVAATGVLALDASGWVPLESSWSPVVVAAVGLLGAGAARWVRWRRGDGVALMWTALALAVSSATVSVVDSVADQGAWAPVVAVAIVLVALATVPAPRHVVLSWFAWAAGGAWFLLLVDRLGLERQWTDAVAAGLGAAALIGGLAVDRALTGPRCSADLVRTRSCRPPVVLGIGTFALGAGLALSHGSEVEVGLKLLGAAGVVAAAALLVSLGWLVGVAELMAVTAVMILVPWTPAEQPLTLAALSAVLLAIAVVTRASGEIGWLTRRLDLPSFVAAHVTAGIGVVVATESSDRWPTWLAVAVLAFAVAAVVRRLEWVAGGSLLLLGAAADAGPGWLTGALVVLGVTLTILGLRTTAPARPILLVGGAAALAGAWTSFAWWQDWSALTALRITVPVAALVAVAAAAAVRLGRVPRDLAITWLGVGAVGVLAAASLLDPDGPRDQGWTVALGLVLLALAAALVAAVTHDLLRWAATGLLASAWLPVLWASQPPRGATVALTTSVALVASVAVLAARAAQLTAAWARPGLVVIGVSQAIGLMAATEAPADANLVIVVLLALAAEMVAVGLVANAPWLVVLSPVPACAAWLLYVDDALEGTPNQLTIPVGATMLVMAVLDRAVRRTRHESIVSADVISLELIGMSFTVASPLALTIGGALWNGVLAIGIGVLLTCWGVLTEVRRRALFGAGVVLLATVLIVAVPLVTGIDWQGPALWLVLALAGLLAVIVATSIERGRARLGEMARRLDELTAGWERMPPLDGHRWLH